MFAEKLDLTIKIIRILSYVFIKIHHLVLTSLKGKQKILILTMSAIYG